MAPPSAHLRLLDLSEDLLYRICSQLPFQEKLQLSLVCRKLRQLGAGPSELWRFVEAQPVVPHQFQAQDSLQQILAAVVTFRVWLVPRAAAVEELRFQLRMPADWQAADSELPSLPSLLAPLLGLPEMPLLRLLYIDWRGSVDVVLYTLLGAPAMPALRTLAFHGGMRLLVPPIAENQAAAAAAADLPNLEAFGLFDSPLAGALNAPWLPSTTTKLCLSNCGLGALPGVLSSLPRLRSLTLDRNGAIDAASFTVLSSLSQLEDLNLSENYLGTFPHQVSQLTSLRILYLHRCFSLGAELAPSDWEALRPLTRLAFLSISGNKLSQLPAVVRGMTQLQAIHLEENEFPDLPVGPYCSNLRELLVDWKNALCSPGMLSACTQLTRLILHDHCVTASDAHQPSVRVPPASATAKAMLTALSSLPALRLVQDVLPPQDYLVMTAPVAHVMWELGRRCPQLQVCFLEGTYVGWTLADLDGSLPPDPMSWP